MSPHRGGSAAPDDFELFFQLAISDNACRDFLRMHLLGEGNYNVIVVDKPELKLPGLIVMEASLLGDLLDSPQPARFVVIARRHIDDYFSLLWRKGFRNVVFDHDSPRIIYLAILAAKLRDFLTEMRRETKWPILPEGGGAVGYSDMRGPFILSDSSIDREVIMTSPGVYILEDSYDLVSFYVAYVGRSDIDVNNQLHVHVGAYERFHYEYCPSALVAFTEECRLYHTFEPPDSFVHPRRPSGTDWTCPQCSY